MIEENHSPVSGASLPAGSFKRSSVVAIIVTTEPELFARIDIGSKSESVLVFDNAIDTKEALHIHKPTVFFADFRSLTDRWTGQRFLNYIKQSPELASTQVWLIANEWHEHQLQWIQQTGAIGFARRNGSAVAGKILDARMTNHAQTPSQHSLAATLAKLDALFSSYAGPKGPQILESARRAFRQGHIEPSVKAYAVVLADSLPTKSQSSDFLQNARLQIQA